jgi:hypothetical protein
MNRRAVITRLLICGLTACVLSVVSMYSYASWSQRAHYTAKTIFEAQQPLEWIQYAQTVCSETKGQPCSDLAELVATVPDDYDESGRYKVERQLEYPDQAPRRSSPYTYTLEAVNADAFEARATHYSGEDIWRVGPEGEVSAVTQSDKRKGYPHDGVARWATLILLVVYLGLLVESAVFYWRQATGRTQRVVSVVSVFGVGLFGPPFAFGVLTKLSVLVLQVLS